MPRPVKCRTIESEIDVAYFKPRGIPSTELEEVTLTFEELEAMRLKDLAGLDQAAAAARMNISRATFQRVLASARAKVSDALATGKAIRIEGGTYAVSSRLVMCRACGHRWNSPSKGVCPECACRDIKEILPHAGGCKSKRCRHSHRE